jgi:tetratricopeptide (TPR) repeat protein
MYWHRIIETSSRRHVTAAGVFRSERAYGKRQRVSQWRIVITLAALLLFVSSARVHAAPYTPAGDHVVLARLPQAPSALVAPPSAPVDPAAALALARSQIDYAGSQDDPRFLGYAQATLAPLLQSSPSSEASLLMARIEQQRHQFARARHRLIRLLEQSPNQGQAWLMLANIDRVQGRLDEAQQACRKAATTLPPTTVLLCQASVQAISGQRDQAYNTLQALASSPAAPQGESARWLATLSAEIAMQQGNLDRASQHLQHALQQAPQAPYLRYLQSDLWLALGQPDAVISDLAAWQDRDGALLRLAIAGQRLGHPQAKTWRQDYRARMAMDQNTGRQRHLREHARFMLEVENDPQTALTLARENWQQQRELADLRLLHAAASAAGDQSALAKLQTFLDRYNVADAQLSQPVRGAAQ